MNQLVAKK